LDLDNAEGGAEGNDSEGAGEEGQGGGNVIGLLCDE
jgi:hypothetical protein